MPAVFCIRRMCESDCSAMARGFLQQGWNKEETQMREYLYRQEQGLHIVLVAECCGEPAGYLLIRSHALEGPFAGKDIPELADFNVLQKYQRRGIGRALLDKAEQMCQAAGRVSLAVGLHSGYGRAQRLYVQRGYLPDGSGVCYRVKNLEEYAVCCNDDDLVLYMSKNLGKE